MFIFNQIQLGTKVFPPQSGVFSRRNLRLKRLAKASFAWRVTPSGDRLAVKGSITLEKKEKKDHANKFCF